MNSFTVLIIETALSGHRGEYVRWITCSFLEKKYKVILALPEDAIKHQSIDGLSDPMLKIVPFEKVLPGGVYHWIKKTGLIGSDYFHYVLFKKIRWCFYSVYRLCSVFNFSFGVAFPQM